MYEMYPDAWAVAEDRSQQTPGAKPRRRARKEHSVLPDVIAHQTQSPKSAHQH